MAEEATTINNSVQDQWGQICSQLKTEVGDTAFDSWLKPLTPGSFNAVSYTHLRAQRP